MQKLLTFFSKNICVNAIFNDQSFNGMLSNDIVSFEQLGPCIKQAIIVLDKRGYPLYIFYLFMNLIDWRFTAQTTDIGHGEHVTNHTFPGHA